MRRKKKNINIRKLNKKGGRGKKSAKSVARSGPGECIHEKVEEEDEVELKSNNNNDLKDIEVDPIIAEPQKMYNIHNTNSIRNSSILNNISNFSNRSMISGYPGSKESRRTKSIKKPVSESVIMMKSMFK